MNQLITIVRVRDGTIAPIYQGMMDPSQRAANFTLFVKDDEKDEKSEFKLTAIVKETDRGPTLQISSEWEQSKEATERVARVAVCEKIAELKTKAEQLYAEGRDWLFPAFQHALISDDAYGEKHQLLEKIRQNKLDENALRAEIKRYQSLESIAISYPSEKTESSSAPVGKFTSFVRGALGYGERTTDVYGGMIRNLPLECADTTPSFPDVDHTDIETSPLVVERRRATVFLQRITA